MTHHNGLTHTSDVWVRTRIEECRQTTSPSNKKKYKTEVIDKVTAQGNMITKSCKRKKEVFFP
jgi:hypothetical protein